MPSVMQIIILLVLVFLIVVPPVMVLLFKRVHGFEKFAWFVGAILFSWIGYIALIVVDRRRRNNSA